MKTKISMIFVAIIVVIGMCSCATQNDRHETMPHATVNARNHPDKYYFYRQDVEFKPKSFWLNIVSEKNYSIIFHSKTSVFEEKLQNTKQYYSESPIAIIVFLGYWIVIIVCWALLTEANHQVPWRNHWDPAWTWSKRIEYLRKINLALMVVESVFLASVLYCIFGEYLWSPLIVPMYYRYISFPNKRNIRRKIYFLLKRIKRIDHSKDLFSPNDFDERLMYYYLARKVSNLESKVSNHKRIYENMDLLENDRTNNLFTHTLSFQWLWKWK